MIEALIRETIYVLSGKAGVESAGMWFAILVFIAGFATLYSDSRSSPTE